MKDRPAVRLLQQAFQDRIGRGLVGCQPFPVREGAAGEDVFHQRPAQRAVAGRVLDRVFHALEGHDLLGHRTRCHGEQDVGGGHGGENAEAEVRRRFPFAAGVRIGEEPWNGTGESVDSGDDACPAFRVVAEAVGGVPGEQYPHVIRGAPLARPGDAALLADRRGHGDRGRPGVLQDLGGRHGPGPQRGPSRLADGGVAGGVAVLVTVDEFAVAVRVQGVHTGVRLWNPYGRGPVLNVGRGVATEPENRKPAAATGPQRAMALRVAASAVRVQCREDVRRLPRESRPA